MLNIYMDSGTSSTRAYLINGLECVDTEREDVGTKDSSISGSNSVLLSGIKRCCDRMLLRNSLTLDDINAIWASGMVTNFFGIIEVPHIETPLDARKLLDTVYCYNEPKFFGREIKLIRGAKTSKQDAISIDNVASVNNVRGEEIEAVGLAASPALSDDTDCAMVSPGSHTHTLRIKNAKVTDILSTFTGELNYAIRKDTILAGELSEHSVEMEVEHVLRGFESLERYGFARALYIVHATKVFGVASDSMRSQMLEGVIAGSSVNTLRRKIAEDWRGVNKIVIIAGKPYVGAYKILCEHLLPEIPVEMYNCQGMNSLALLGFLDILRLYCSENKK